MARILLNIKTAAAIDELARACSADRNPAEHIVSFVLDCDVKDRLLVNTEFKRLEEGLRGRGESLEKLAREAAKELISWAHRKPHLLREKWGQIASMIRHADWEDVVVDAGCPDFPHTDVRTHTDCGIRGLTFPPKPTDF